MWNDCPLCNRPLQLRRSILQESLIQCEYPPCFRYFVYLANDSFIDEEAVFLNCKNNKQYIVSQSKYVFRIQGYGHNFRLVIKNNDPKWKDANLCWKNLDKILSLLLLA